jgi:hypothetical protein
MMGKIIKGLLGLLVVLIICVVAMVFMPKTVNVAYTEADLQSYLAKGGIILDERSASFEDIVLGQYESVGVVSVDDFITSEEATAILNAVSREKSVLSDVRVKFVGRDKVAASAKITADMSPIYNVFPAVKPFETLINTVVGRTLYVEMDLRQAQGNQFEALFTSVSVGMLPLPVNQANEVGTQMGSFMNNLISQVPGFNMDTFYVDETGLHFKGTIPKEVQSRLD